MGQDYTADETKLERVPDQEAGRTKMFCSEFSDEALEIQGAEWRGKPIGNMTLAYCTALSFCPGP